MSINITYRQLTAHEAERISELEISDFIKRSWRKVNGVKQWVEINWLDKGLPDGYENHLAALKATFEGISRMMDVRALAKSRGKPIKELWG